MAIKIPSKNIYEMNNPKIRDNVVDNVSVEQTIVTKNNDYRKSIETIKRDIEISELEIYEDSDRQTYTYNTHGEEFTAVASVSAKIGFLNISISISETIKNGIINEIYDGLDKNNNVNIPYTLYYKDKNGELLSGVLSDGLPVTVSATVTGPTTASVTLPDYTDNTKQQWSYDDGVFSINLKILVYKKTIKSEKTISGTRAEEQEYTSEKIEITIYGDTIGIDISDGSITYIKDANGEIVQGKGKKPYSLSANELLQDSGKVGETLLTEHLANNVLNQYAKGKETATLLCDIADYYDESGEKVIDIKTEKMSFRLHDEVIPYVFGADGKDKPMSKHQDGSAKVFEVVGSNIIYDGAVWQELSLLEKK